MVHVRGTVTPQSKTMLQSRKLPSLILIGKLRYTYGHTKSRLLKPEQLKETTCLKRIAAHTGNSIFRILFASSSTLERLVLDTFCSISSDSDFFCSLSFCLSFFHCSVSFVKNSRHFDLSPLKREHWRK